MAEFHPQYIDECLTTLSCPHCWQHATASYFKGSNQFSCSHCNTNTMLVDALMLTGRSRGTVIAALCRAAGFPSQFDLIPAKGIRFQSLLKVAERNRVGPQLEAQGLPANAAIGFVDEPFAAEYPGLRQLTEMSVIPWFHVGAFQLAGYRLHQGQLILEHEPFWHDAEVRPCQIGHGRNKAASSLQVVSDPMLATLLLARGQPTVATGYKLQHACIHHLAQRSSERTVLNVVAGPDDNALWEAICAHEIQAERITPKRSTNAQKRPIDYAGLLQELKAQFPTTVEPTQDEGQIIEALTLATSLLRDGKSLPQTLEVTRALTGIMLTIQFKEN